MIILQRAYNHDLYGSQREGLLEFQRENNNAPNLSYFTKHTNKKYLDKEITQLLSLFLHNIFFEMPLLEKNANDFVNILMVWNLDHNNNLSNVQISRKVSLKVCHINFQQELEIYKIIRTDPKQYVQSLDQIL